MIGSPTLLVIVRTSARIIQNVPGSHTLILSVIFSEIVDFKSSEYQEKVSPRISDHRFIFSAVRDA